MNRDPIDTATTAFLVALLVLTLAAVTCADLRDQRRCEAAGGHVVETRHGWRCVGGGR